MPFLIPKSSVLAVLAAMTMLFGTTAHAASFLWRVEKDGHTAYLTGSMHFADESMYPLAPAFEHAFQQSDALVVEADITADPAALARLLMELAVAPPGEPLSKVLSDEAKTAFQRAGLDWTRYDGFRPWYALTAMQAEQMVKLGFRPELGIDMHFLERAHGMGMPVLELESVEEQFHMLAALGEIHQDAYLRFSLLQMRTMDKLARQLADLWIKGDATGLEQMLFGSPLFNAVFKPLNETLYFERNRRMSDAIMNQLVAEDTHFIIVGAGHLVGPQGLLRLLSDKGCTLSQL